MDTCPYLRVLREWLGKVIECRNCSYLFARPLVFHRGISMRSRVPCALAPSIHSATTLVATTSRHDQEKEEEEKEGEKEGGRLPLEPPAAEEEPPEPRASTERPRRRCCSPCMAPLHHCIDTPTPPSSLHCHSG
jgi:hypothetical protein